MSIILVGGYDTCLRSEKKILLSLNVKSVLKGIQAEVKFCPPKQSLRKHMAWGPRYQFLSLTPLLNLHISQLRPGQVTVPLLAAVVGAGGSLSVSVNVGGGRH